MLVQNWGISGVLVGTIVSDWLTTMWFDPIIIHKYGYKNRYPVKNYFFTIIKYFLISFTVGGIDYLICTHFMTGYSWFSVIIHAAVVVFTVPVVLLGITFNNSEGRYVRKLGMGYVKKITGKFRRKG